MRTTDNFADVIKEKLAVSPELSSLVEAERSNVDIAMKVYEMRKDAGITQKELADRIGSKQSVISRIEDADYDGHSITLLRRIASALGKRLVVDFYDLPSYCKASLTSDSFDVDWNSLGCWSTKDEEEVVIS